MAGWDRDPSTHIKSCQRTEESWKTFVIMSMSNSFESITEA